MQKCFDIVMGQCSPAIKQHLKADDSFTEIKVSDSVKLIQLLKRLCYKYNLYGHTPPGAWYALEILTGIRQPDTVHEVKQYETLWSAVEICKARKVKFAMICTENIDMAIQVLKDNAKISQSGTFDE